MWVERSSSVWYNKILAQAHDTGVGLRRWPCCNLLPVWAVSGEKAFSHKKHSADSQMWCDAAKMQMWGQNMCKQKLKLQRMMASLTRRYIADIVARWYWTGAHVRARWCCKIAIPWFSFKLNFCYMFSSPGTNILRTIVTSCCFYQSVSTSCCLRHCYAWYLVT